LRRRDGLRKGRGRSLPRSLGNAPRRSFIHWFGSFSKWFRSTIVTRLRRVIKFGRMTALKRALRLMRKTYDRRAEGGWIDCRIISAGLLGGVHDRATEPAGNRESSDHRKVIATCPEMFGLAS
jgi:hypothetical protein